MLLLARIKNVNFLRTKAFFLRLRFIVILIIFQSVLPGVHDLRAADIRGTVKSADSRQALAAVQIKLHDAETSKDFSTETDKHGAFRFKNLKQHIFTLETELKGYQRHFISFIQVMNDSTYEFNILLDPVKSVEPPKSFDTYGSIFGKICDDHTKEPLENVNIYLDGLGIGAATDSMGKFKIDKAPAGWQKIIISHIAYSSVTIDSLHIEVDQTYQISRQLKKKVIE